MRTTTHSQSSTGSGTHRYEGVVHTPVLLHEVIDGLALSKDATLVDGTLGLGGHAKALLANLNSDAVFIGIDQDAHALSQAEKNIGQQHAKMHFVKDAFQNIVTILERMHCTHADAILLDLGWGSHTLVSGRGFSFNSDEPLTMTYDSEPGSETLTAYDIVNTWSQDSLESILEGWGEESHARRIAQAIVAERVQNPIARSGQLAALIERTVRRSGKTHPATKTFQALRIAVNSELSTLKDALCATYKVLSPKGRLAVITFHSLEDRIVKHTFKELAADGAVLITKKAIQPSREEARSNPRSRSAKLRIISTP